VHIGETNFTAADGGWNVSVPIYLSELAETDIRVEAYAEAAEVGVLDCDGRIPGTTGGYFYRGTIAGTRPSGDYTVRVVPSGPGVRVPSETALIRWQK
jgi:starch phosphorylase